jgi:Flp pilus assembly protein TadG
MAKRQPASSNRTVKFASRCRGFRDLSCRLFRHRDGNVAIIFALCLIPLVFLAGMALDYAAAIQKRQRLNAAADSAVLAAVSPALANQTAAQAQTVATNLFNGQASVVTGLTGIVPTVTINQNGLARTATVTYASNSTNSFPNVLGQASWPLSGSSTASSMAAPSIDFYVMLDNSPSMAIAATTAGINKMIANTPQQGGGAGCAFACHQSSPNSGDTPGNPVGWDNYKLAQSLGVVTRIQNLATATQSLTSTAAALAAQTNSAFRMGVYSFNSSNSGSALNTVQSLTTNLTLAGTAASGVDVLQICKGNYITCSTYDDSTNTDFAAAMTSMNSTMSTPGTGASGSSPQAILFIVTDGVEDKKANSCAYTMINLSGFNRCIQPVDISKCATIKARGIQIAILYTQYYPLGSDSFYQQYVAPFQSGIGTNLQNCASSGLYFAVTTDNDITSALTTLFNSAVQSVESHLSN